MQPTFKRYNRGPQSGFTLIELLVVVAVIAVLASLLAPTLEHAKLRAKIARVHSDLRQIGIALEMYRQDCGWYPFARLSCTGNQEVDYYEFPRELAQMHYISARRLADPFNQTRLEDKVEDGRLYKYVVVGWQYSNGARVPGGMWIPPDYPQSRRECEYYYRNKGQFYRLGQDLNPMPARPPVYWAVWSVGPAGDPGWTRACAEMAPVPKGSWYPYRRDGLIVRLSDERTSP